ncbi:hypothetical protein WG922_02250 [Ramlibacter sp. AN1015]|uniref:hypothetical protein n=1 Tax=Ramlibacter sp. AN1015 TaxID=3133428 RepID=UPI0030BDED08
MALALHAPAHAAGRPRAAGHPHVCEFQAPAGFRLGFGGLMPNAADVVRRSATASAGGAVGGCLPYTTMQFSVHRSDHAMGAQLRLRQEGGAEYIAYKLIFDRTMPSPGPARYVPFAVAGEIVPEAFRDAPVGSYRDTVVLQVTQ